MLRRRRRLGVGGFWFRLLVVVPVGEIFEPPSGGGGGRRRRRFRARAWGHRRLVFKMIDFSNCQKSRLLLKKKRDPQTLSKKNENNDQHQRGPRARPSSRGETSASPVSREPPPRSDEETDIDFCEDV